MSIPGTVNPNTTSGTQLATIINDFVQAFASGNAGTVRDPNLLAGGMWVDTTDAGSGKLYLKFYTGTADILFATFDTTNNTVGIAGSTGSFQVIQISDDIVGPILELAKKRETGGGQTLDGDILGDLDFSGHDSSAVKYVMARIRTISQDDVAVGVRGSDMGFFVTPEGLNSLAEKMRLKGDGKLGIGTITPSELLEVFKAGDAAMKVARQDATVDPARMVISKKKNADLGQTKQNDVLGRVEFNGFEEAGNEVTLAKIETKVLEDTNTGVGQGSELNVSVIGEGETAFTEIAKLKKGACKVDEQSLTDQDLSAALAHGGVNQNLFSVDGSKFKSFEATVFSRGTDSTPDARTIKYTINGYYKGSNNWIITKDYEAMEGDKLFDVSYVDGETVQIQYLNKLDNGAFVGGNISGKVRRFA